MRKSGLSAHDHDDGKCDRSVRPGTRPSAAKATLGRNKLWVTTGAANHPALTKSKRPTPVFPVPADSLKACAYTQMRGVPQGVGAGFCWEGRNRRRLTHTPPSVQPERSRRPRFARAAGRALRLRSVRTDVARRPPSPFPPAHAGGPLPSPAGRGREARQRRKGEGASPPTL